MEAYLPVLVLIVDLLFIVLVFLYLRAARTHKKHLQSINEFMAVMIHELRSPLSVIRSSTDMILKQAPNLSSEQISEMLEQMEESSVELLKLVNDLLDIAKIEAGKVELFKHIIDLNEIIADTASSYESLINEKGLSLVLELDESLAPVSADPEKIHRVLNNLMSNAVKYTEKGAVTVRTYSHQGMLAVSIEDTGIGIPDETKQKLFNKYARVSEAASKKGRGTGLGLVIVKGIIVAHNGNIWIEDNVPYGSRFVFTLPFNS